MLLAHRSLPTAALISATGKAIQAGALNPQVVLIEARREAASQLAPVAAIGALARYDRPTPTLANYDALLAGNNR